MANTFTNRLHSEIGTGDVIVYTPGSGIVYSTVIGYTVANVLNTNIVVDLFIRDTDSTEVYLLKGTTVEPGQAIVPVGGEQKLVVLPNQEICVRSNIVNSADCTISILEISS
jgi:hypothetical protein